MNRLQQFQKKHCLTPDGIIGPNTLAKMKQVWCLNDCQLSHFLGQIVHETGHFRYEEENLNYSTEALLRVFRKYFPTRDAAAKVARKPQEIANIVYGGRMGNDQENDGWKFRGRGALQLTGRDNYEMFANKIGDLQILRNPDLVIEKYFFESGLFYFTRNNLWRLCEVVSNDSILKVSKRVNGGTNGLEDRMELTFKFFRQCR